MWYKAEILFDSPSLFQLNFNVGQLYTIHMDLVEKNKKCASFFVVLTESIFRVSVLRGCKSNSGPLGKGENKVTKLNRCDSPAQLRVERVWTQLTPPQLVHTIPLSIFVPFRFYNLTTTASMVGGTRHTAV